MPCGKQWRSELGCKGDGTKWTGACESSFGVNVRDWWWIEYVERRTGVKDDGAWASGHANHWERRWKRRNRWRWGGVTMSSVRNILSLWSLWIIQGEMKVIWQYVSTVRKMFLLLGISFKIVTLKNCTEIVFAILFITLKKLEATYMSDPEVIVNKSHALKKLYCHKSVITKTVQYGKCLWRIKGKNRVQNCILEMIAIRLEYMHLKNILQGTLENEDSYLSNIN